MTMLAKFSRQEQNDMNLHYLLKPEFGIDATNSGNRWKQISTQILTVYYDLSDPNLLNLTYAEHAFFHSGHEWGFLDEELKKLKISPQETIAIKFNIVVTQTPSKPLLVVIMTYPMVEALGAIMLLAGLTALTAALITLIPIVATSAAINLSHIVLAGGILCTIGLTMSLATHYSKIALDNAPVRVDVDVTLEQEEFPESKIRLIPEAQKILFYRFFSKPEPQNDFNKEDNYNSQFDLQNLS